MNETVLYDLTEQLERIAGVLEGFNETMKPLATGLTALNGYAEPLPEDEPVDASAGRHLSLFLENLPTWQYNCLRRKVIPLSMAAKILGVSSPELATLTRLGAIKAKSGRYDVLNLLMWLDSQAAPEGGENETFNC